MRTYILVLSLLFTPLAFASKEERTLVASILTDYSKGQEPASDVEIQTVSEAFISAAKLTVEGIHKVISLGNGSFSIVFKSRAHAETAFTQLPLLCEASLLPGKFALHLSWSTLDFSEAE